MSEDRDLIVLGGGPGGYVAALRAANLGLKATLIEKDPWLGGTCLHRGCIPTKALLHTADLLEQIREAARFGIDASEPRLDIDGARAYKKRVIETNARGIDHLMRRAGIERIQGRGRLLAPGRMGVETEDGSMEIEAANIIVATGSRPATLPIAPTDGNRVLDSDQILELHTPPTSLVVLGAGAVGVELATIYAAFGAEVTLVEMMPRVLPLEDEEISRELGKALRKKGIRVLTETQAKSVEIQGELVRVVLDQDGSEAVIEAATLLVAIGRRPVTEGLGLEDLGVATDRGFIDVDPHMRTSVAGIWAIGDVVATPQLAHLASAEGILAVETIAGIDPRPIRYEHVPSCTYCEPQVASVGLSEARARELHGEITVARFPFAGSAKASILGRREGLIKLISEPRDDQVLGVHIVGAQASELIAEACLALELESTTAELFHTIHAHPTLSETLMEVARAAAGQPMHA